MVKIHTCNHIRYYSSLLSSQLERPSLHNMCFRLDLAAINDPQNGWCQRHHCSSYQPGTISHLMACLIALKTYQRVTGAIFAEMDYVAAPKVSSSLLSTSSLMILPIPNTMARNLMAPQSRINSLGPLILAL